MPKFLLVVALFLTGCGGVNAQPATVKGEPIVVTSTPTTVPSLAIAPTPTGAATPMPAATTEPQRVQFAAGTYGTTLQGSGEARYLLWARARQRFTMQFADGGGCYAKLNHVGNDGTLLTANGEQLVATLQADGDHVLAVRCPGAYSIAVEIR